ncbi:MAG: hypothetical protein HY923_09930 [Elusimicrobia bacterium]|nr:hypothetical protein [Elusimicrobiota bacterium]
MSAEHPHSSKFGMILTLVAICGSAVAVLAWQMYSNRHAGLDTSGFDMSATTDTRPVRAAVPSAPAGPAEPNSLGMVKSDAGMSVMAPGSSAPTKAQDTAAKPADKKADALPSLKEALAANEAKARAYIMKMQAKYPSIAQYGKDWMANPELRALRDQYWKDKDPVKFMYGVAKSDGFGQLVRKYAADPGIRAVLVGGIKEAPGSLTAPAAQIIANDKIAKNLVETVVSAAGLPKSLLPMLGGDADSKPPDTSQVLSEIMNSPGVKNAQKGAVSLDQKDIDKAKEQAAPNGFSPLGGR